MSESKLPGLMSSMVAQYRNRTPLHDAAQNRSCGMAELLLGAGADMNAETLVSDSVLHSSRFDGVACQGGSTPLRIAESEEATDMMVVLQKWAAQQ